MSDDTKIDSTRARMLSRRQFVGGSVAGVAAASIADVAGASVGMANRRVESLTFDSELASWDDTDLTFDAAVPWA